MTFPVITLEDVRTFWFEEAGPAAWYRVSPAFDARMRRRFARMIEHSARDIDQGRAPAIETPEDALAIVLLFDQFPRNIWRGSGKAFAFDRKARDLSHMMIDRGFDWAIDESQRAFVYMPFMHSESLEDQDLCISMAADRLDGQGTHTHAVKHREVIAQFGRFPFRNVALGRVSTPEEIAFLDGGGYAPGRKDSAKSSGR
jgi:uncharacterized protein (DUF924 family)